MQKAALLGHPVGQSLSPMLHHYWLKQYGIEGSYEAVDVRPEALAATLDQFQGRGYCGFNLTIPHKEAALTLMDELCPIAQKIGAVNTIVIREDGSRLGINTDAEGFISSLRQSCPQLETTLDHCLILGAGGAAKAVYYALKQAGAKKISISNRSPEKCASFDATAITWSEKESALHDVTLLVNTTSLGMIGQPELTLDLAALPKQALVTDIVYKPLQTELLKQAKARGNKVVGGLGMLLHQAVPAFEAWFGQRPEVSKQLTELLESHIA